MQRRTRIVATLGPATDRPGVLEKLVDAGLDVARINFSHGNAEDHKARINLIRQLAKDRKRNVAILGDLPGPKLRALLKEPLALAVGQKVTLAVKAHPEADIQLTEPEAVSRVKIGHRVLLDDGRLQARIAFVTKELVTLSIEVGGTLLPNKGINLPDTELHIPAVTMHDRDAIALALFSGVDWLALSFVRDASAAHELRGVIRGYSLEVPILAKIERPEAVKKSAEIIDSFDGIMVARGDLGVEIALEKVPHVQKELILQARLAGKPVITATDMLDSMRHNPRPTRAEVSDVANAIYDGTDAVMLSAETSTGSYPVEAVSYMKRIAIEAEKSIRAKGFEERRRPVQKENTAEVLADAAYNAARAAGVTALIVFTTTGSSARLIARYRPPVCLYAITPDPEVARRLSVTYGVLPIVAPHVDSTDEMLTQMDRVLLDKGFLRADDLVIFVAGQPVCRPGTMNLMKVHRLGETS